MPLISPSVCEVDVVAGLEPVAREELRRRFGAQIVLRVMRPSPTGPTNIQLSFAGDPAELTTLRTVVAVYLVHHVSVPRPRSLLANQHLAALLLRLNRIMALNPAAYRTLSVSAAGANSPVLLRFKQTVAERLSLAVVPQEGDLYLRLRRPLDGGPGWDVLIRLTPRPLATRPWRVRNMPGALDATVAHAMILLTRPRPEDVFLNIACGSGTFLIERATACPARRIIGCDISATAREMARENIAASDVAERIELHAWDARMLPLPAGSVDAACCALPFGHHIGSHAENVALYPVLFAEVARVAQSRAAFAAVTTEVRLTTTILENQRAWVMERILSIGLNGLFPRIFVLRRQ
jgi:ubiquinone/menaquinone biosynthesis C-methylase UbiE